MYYKIASLNFHQTFFSNSSCNRSTCILLNCFNVCIFKTTLAVFIFISASFTFLIIMSVSSKHLLILKTSSRYVLKTSSTRLQRNNFVRVSGGRSVSFPENFTYVLNEFPMWNNSSKKANITVIITTNYNMVYCSS